MGYLVLFMAWVLFILDVFKARTAVRAMLYRAMDYRDAYIIRSGHSNRYKWGISVDAPKRAKDIDRSIKGTKESLVNHWRLFYARHHEARIRKRIKGSNFNFRGSGYTEWHKMPRSITLVREDLWILRWEVRKVYIKQQICLFCVVSAMIAALCFLLRYNYPHYF